MLEDLMRNDFNFESYTELNDNLLFLDYISQNFEYEYVTVEPATAYKFRGNFYGLLTEMRVDPDLFVYTSYINGLNNPVDYTGEKCVFKLAIKPPIPFS